MTLLQKMISFVLLSTCFLLMQISTAVAVVHVNETMGDFRIGFEASDDTNVIVKYWNASGFGIFTNLSKFDASSSYAVAAANSSGVSNRLLAAVVFTSRMLINTSDFERGLVEDYTSKYIRINDRTIDGHHGFLVQSGNSSQDPLMTYIAAYWLDETNGSATKFVIGIAGYPWNEGSGAMINTLHVEEISNPVQNANIETQKMATMPGGMMNMTSFTPPPPPPQ